MEKLKLLSKTGGRNNKQSGVIISYVLVFGAIFLLMLSGLLGYILMQLRQAGQRVSWSQALNIAEAGIDYYGWCLNNGVEADCLGEKNYYDGKGAMIGKFLIEVDSSLSCGETVQRRIIATGWTDQYPSLKRKISVILGRESVAKYSYIINSSVWIGADHNITGLYHSNGGIRMDGRNQSLMTSAAVLNEIGEWVCTDTFGCDPCPTGAGKCRISNGKCLCPSIFTTTSNSTPSLFEYPVPPFDFNSITIDLAEIRRKAINGGGLYFQNSIDLMPGTKGYHLIFKNDGTVEVWLVRALQQTNGYSEEEGWRNDRFTINNEVLYNTYAIPASCSVIFIEDNMWVEGTVKGKVVAASANIDDDNVETDIILPANINYSSYSGSDGLALIAERNILIAPQSPENMELHSILVAQKGRFGRNHYPDNFRDSLKIYGSIISNGRVGTQWTSGGQMVSGYAQRESYFDQNLVYNPPPFVSHMSNDYKIVSWEEIE
jgi:hypothetical protein